MPKCECCLRSYDHIAGRLCNTCASCGCKPGNNTDCEAGRSTPEWKDEWKDAIRANW